MVYDSIMFFILNKAIFLFLQDNNYLYFFFILYLIYLNILNRMFSKSVINNLRKDYKNNGYVLIKSC